MVRIRRRHERLPAEIADAGLNLLHVVNSESGAGPQTYRTALRERASGVECAARRCSRPRGPAGGACPRLARRALEIGSARGPISFYPKETGGWPSVGLARRDPTLG